MGYAIALSALLIAGTVAAVVALRRTRTAPGATDLDAEAEANRWLIRLGGSLMPPGASSWANNGTTAGRALTDAAECHRTARSLLAEARTAAEYERVTRTAQEGLRHVEAAREALGQAAEQASAAPEPAPLQGCFGVGSGLARTGAAENNP
ncbi:hypothetical protein [Streptomyces guryensis]|uniref:Uncharacterized protein n=1 Tax=Streptomyces guryensis TaxID=2886947 RepID=A0A9Q3VTA3_9ACTN|nr:hypothetical protein [Streptomyces guryensis]MCD9876875.1 hypothetical protein [Streptomyces guryensis]